MRFKPFLEGKRRLCGPRGFTFATLRPRCLRNSDSNLNSEARSPCLQWPRALDCAPGRLGSDLFEMSQQCHEST